MDEDKVKVEDKTPLGKTSVFLAWSGPVSQKMAGLLKDYLPLFVRNITIFMSEDITKGKRWHTEIANALGSTKFGILCLTPENLASEWIHFEAGALSKTIDDSTHVCPLLLDVKMSELKEPLASFHATLFEKEEFKKLVKALAQACGDSLEEGQFNTLMEALWPKIDQSTKSLKAELVEDRRKTGKPEDAKPKVDPLLEEVVVRVREQGRLLATLAEQGGTGGKEVLQAVLETRASQQHMLEMLSMKLMEQNAFLRDRGRGDDDDLRSQLGSPRMVELVYKAIGKMPMDFLAERNPEAVLDTILRLGFITESDYKELGRRSSWIHAITLAMSQRMRRPSADSEPSP